MTVLLDTEAVTRVPERADASDDATGFDLALIVVEGLAVTCGEHWVDGLDG